MLKTFGVTACLACLAMTQTAAAEDTVGVYGAPISSTVIVSFTSSSAQFRPTQEQVEMLNDAKSAALVTVRGRTSTPVYSKRDERLALMRALSARSYLIEHGVSPLKISLNFASAADYIADNRTNEGRRENQRVEVDMVYVPPLAH